MLQSSQILSLTALVATGSLIPLCANAADGSNDRSDRSIRYEISMGFNHWAALDDLQPVARGEFENVGYSFGGALHWPLTAIDDGNFLLGVDAGVLSNESDIASINNTLVARGLYLAPSVKWQLGETRRLSVDGGLGVYLVDIAELSGNFQVKIEREIWEQSEIGGFIGGTWNFRSSSDTRKKGWMISFKTHFFDLGTAKDEDPGLPVLLGANAGELKGPVYQLQIGYRWE